MWVHLIIVGEEEEEEGKVEEFLMSLLNWMFLLKLFTGNLPEDLKARKFPFDNSILLFILEQFMQ